MLKFSKFSIFCLLTIAGTTLDSAPALATNLPGYPCLNKGSTQLSETEDSIIACVKTSPTVPALIWKSMNPLLMDTTGNVSTGKNIAVGGSITAGSTITSSKKVEATTGVKVGSTTELCNTTSASTLRMNGTALEFCNGAKWVSLSTPEPPKGTICGYATNGDTFDPAASYCKGFNVRHGCPEGYTQSHWYVTDWGNGHLWFCTKQ